MTPSYIRNLKSLASIVAEISRGPKIFRGAPLAQSPANFGSKSRFWHDTPRTKFCTKFEVTIFNGCRNK